MNAVQPIRDKEKIQEILRFLYEWNYKYYLMFLMGIRSGLRISDILKLKVKDVREADGRIKTHLVTKEKKTSKRKRIKLHSDIKRALAEYISDKDSEAYLIKSNKKDKFKDNKPLSRQRAWEVMKVASDFVGLSEIGCHTLRKTFGYHYYQQTKDIALLMYLFNHSKSEITLRYIGITDDMMDKAFDSVDYEY